MQSSTTRTVSEQPRAELMEAAEKNSSFPGCVAELLHPSTAWEMWPDTLAPIVEHALALDVYSLDPLQDVALQVQTGAAAVVLVHTGARIDAAAVLQRQRTRAGDYKLHVLAVAGDGFDTWGEVLLDKVREIAGQQGANGITMAGRPGWSRRLNHLGFRTVHVEMELAL